MTIGRIIEGRSTSIHCCEKSVSVREAVALLSERHIGALPVLDEGRVVGIFSERDVIHRLHAEGPSMLDKTVGEVMTSPPVTVLPETGALSALALMTRRRIRHLPVMEGDQMTAFVSIGDIVKYRIERIEAEAEAMRAYIQAA